MTFIKNHTSFMQEALFEAKKAEQQGEVPVGAVIVFQNEIIARAGNQICLYKNPTAHAEIIVIQQASQILQTERLNHCDLYVTLEPCAMCAGAIALARIRRLYYAAADEKTGAVEHGCNLFSQKTCHHKPEIYPSLCEAQSRFLLQNFFKLRR